MRAAVKSFHRQGIMHTTFSKSLRISITDNNTEAVRIKEALYRNNHRQVRMSSSITTQEMMKSSDLIFLTSYCERRWHEITKFCNRDHIIVSTVTGIKLDDYFPHARKVLMIPSTLLGEVPATIAWYMPSDNLPLRESMSTLFADSYSHWIHESTLIDSISSIVRTSPACLSIFLESCINSGQRIGMMHQESKHLWINSMLDVVTALEKGIDGHSIINADNIGKYMANRIDGYEMEWAIHILQMEAINTNLRLRDDHKPK